jgi:hypothetical protein
VEVRQTLKHLFLLAALVVEFQPVAFLPMFKLLLYGTGGA